MSLDACLVKLQAEGKIDRDRAARFAELYRDMEGRYTKQYGAAPGKVLAAEDTVKALEWDAALRRRQAALQVEAQRTGYAHMDSYDDGSGLRDGQAIRAMMARDPSGRSNYQNVEGLAEQLDFAAHAKLHDFLETFRKNLAGQVRNKALLDEVIDARHGDTNVGEDAKAMSDAYGEVADGSREQFNMLGGDIGYDAKWGVPHSHSAYKVRKVAYEIWRDGGVPAGEKPLPGSVMAEIDPARMKDPMTGQEFTAHGLEDALQQVYQTIRTDGLAGNATAEIGGSSKLANRRSDARFLQFKDGAAWRRYNALYGESDPFTAMMSHVHGINRDIALMQRFGPNPDETVKWLTKQMAARYAQRPDTDVASLNVPRAEAYKIEKMWNVLAGDATIPVVGGPVRMAVGQTLQGARNVLTAAKLGKAVFRKLGDIPTDAAARRFNGLPQIVPFVSMLKEMTSQADHKLAVQLELGMRDAAMTTLGLNRYLGMTHGPEITRTMADSAMRISGLNAVHDARLRLFGRDFLATLALNKGNEFADLPEALGKSLTRYGIDEAGWDAMRAAPTYSERGGEWMSGKLVRESNPQVAERMMDMVLSEMAVAVQASTLRGRTLTNTGRPLTFAGEVGSSLTQFKTFAASLMFTQVARMTGMETAQLGAIYAARMVIGMTMFGAIITQLRQITTGQDLRPMNTADFWIDALFQGGGLGIAGDLIDSFKREGASGPASALLGPLTGVGIDVGKATVGQAFAAGRGQQTHVGRAAIDLLRQNTPYSNTWYLSAAFNRLIFDQLQELADPQYKGAYARSQERAAKQGAPFYWKPGELAPERAPALNTAMGAQQQGALQ
jgi:hypothetical protein